jgi:hypothetical protein
MKLRLACFVRNTTGCFWPILLKKSAMVSSAEKYASEIEIFAFGRGFRTRISRSSVQKRRFHQSMIRPFGRTGFFNSIGRFPPFATGKNWPVAVLRDRQKTAKSGPCHKNVNLHDSACSVLQLAHSLATSITRNLFADKPDEGYS